MRSDTHFRAEAELGRLLNIEIAVARAAIKTLVADGVLARSKNAGNPFARDRFRAVILQTMVVKAVQLLALTRDKLLHTAGAVTEQKRSTDPTAPILLTIKDESRDFVAVIGLVLFRSVENKKPQWSPVYYRICAILSGRLKRDRGGVELIEFIAEIQHPCLQDSVGFIPAPINFASPGMNNH